MLISPYYFSHKLALQLCGAQVKICNFDKHTLMPNWDDLGQIMARDRPKAIVITTPNNPSGAIWTEDDLKRVIDLAKLYQSWLIVDQTYYEFIFQDRNNDDITDSFHSPCLLYTSPSPRD